MTGPPDTLHTRIPPTIIVAWNSHDTELRDDGRFWMRVPPGAALIFGEPAGALVPRGKPLASWRARAQDDVVEVRNPVTDAAERFSLARWADADADQTRLLISFLDPAADHPRPGSPTDPHLHEVHHVRPDRSVEAARLEDDLADLQRRYRQAQDRGDQAAADELAGPIDAVVDGLRRAAFPDYAPGWDLSRAVPDGDNRLILDWTTGY